MQEISGHHTAIPDMLINKFGALAYMHLDKSHRENGPMAPNGIMAVFLGLCPVNMSNLLLRIDTGTVYETIHCTITDEYVTIYVSNPRLDTVLQTPASNISTDTESVTQSRSEQVSLQGWVTLFVR